MIKGTELKDLLFLISQLKNKDAHIREANKSIFKKASYAILQFPIIASDSLSIDSLMIVNKSLELNYCSYVRVAMGLNNVVTENEIRKYIKQFHTNDNLTVDDRYNTNMDFNYALDDLVKKDDSIYTLSNEDVIYPYTENELTIDRLGLNKDNLNSSTLISEFKRDEHTNLFTEAKRRNNATTDTIYYDNSKKTSTRNTTIINNTSTRTREYNTPKLLDSEVKRTNDLEPTTFELSLYQEIDGEVINKKIILGVKATTHKVNSEVMVDNIVKSIDEKKGFFKFIQWTTGEIKFFKDYLLCLDNIKQNALNYRNNRNDEAWFKALKNKATLLKVRSNFHINDTLIPNSTIVISMDEVDYIRNNYNIDLYKDYGILKKLMDIYCLIGFVIVDEASEVAYFYFDGDKRYQIHTIKSLKKNNRDSVDDMKALVSLMSH